jgi:hypothetical protein
MNRVSAADALAPIEAIARWCAGAQRRRNEDYKRRAGRPMNDVPYDALHKKNSLFCMV